MYVKKHFFEFSAEQGARRRQEFGSDRVVQATRAADHRSEARLVPRVVQVKLAHVKAAAIVRRDIRHTQVRRGLASRLNIIICNYLTVTVFCLFYFLFLFCSKQNTLLYTEKCTNKNA